MHFHYKFIHLEQAIKSVCNNFSKSFFYFMLCDTCVRVRICLFFFQLVFQFFLGMCCSCIVYYFSFKQPKHIQLSDFIRWVNNKSFLSSSNRAFDSVHTSCAIVFGTCCPHQSSSSSLCSALIYYLPCTQQQSSSSSTVEATPLICPLWIATRVRALWQNRMRKRDIESVEAAKVLLNMGSPLVCLKWQWTFALTIKFIVP